MQNVEDFQRSILVMDGLFGKAMMGGRQVLIYSSIKAHPGNFIWSIQISDLIDKHFELEMGIEDFERHMEEIKANNSDWTAYFNLLKKVIVDKKFEIVERSNVLRMNLDYPLGEAILKGTLELKKRKIDRDRLAMIVFQILDEPRNLEPVPEKRKRSESPKIRQAPVLATSSVPKPVPPNRQLKRRKQKQIGTKLAD